MKFGAPWTEQEKALLAEKYATSIVGELMQMLPGRTAYAIASKARELGLKTSRETCLRGNKIGKVVWTDWEKYHLRHIFSTSSTRELLLVFPNRTAAAIKVQADVLGLRRTDETNRRIRTEAQKMVQEKKRAVKPIDAPPPSESKKIVRTAIARRTPLEQAWCGQ